MNLFLQAAEAAQAVQDVVAEESVRMGLWELFLKGGWLMWPLLALGGVTVGHPCPCGKPHLLAQCFRSTPGGLGLKSPRPARCS